MIVLVTKIKRSRTYLSDIFPGKSLKTIYTKISARREVSEHDSIVPNPGIVSVSYFRQINLNLQ